VKEVNIDHESKKRKVDGRFKALYDEGKNKQGGYK